MILKQHSADTPQDLADWINENIQPGQIIQILEGGTYYIVFYLG